MACNSNSNSTTESDSSMSSQSKVDTSTRVDSNAVVTQGPTNDANVVMSGNDFISKNITDNEMEIELAKMQVDKGTSQQLKKAARQIMDDHTQMLNDLRALAAKKQVTVPATNTQMSAMASLPSTTGKEFDAAWLGQMLTMHEAKINELENALTQTQDADVKTLATKALSQIKSHRDMLMKITGTTVSAQPQ
jgi:putative membrane protein